jgi:hypothetical protein
MYSYIKSIGSNMSSFFSYILNCTSMRKKYKTDERTDDEDEIVWYDNIYCDNNNKQFLHVNLLEE